MFLNRQLGSVGAIWGAAGTITLLSFAIYRMYQHASDAFTYPWSTPHYLVLVLWSLFMAYSEGFKGFQRGFSPRVAARAVYLRTHATPFRFLLAPLFCMGFFHAPRKRRITVFVLLILITSIVILFQYIPQPWRGILDIGVIIGLSWGITATLYFLATFWNSSELPSDPEVVETDGTK